MCVKVSENEVQDIIAFAGLYSGGQNGLVFIWQI